MTILYDSDSILGMMRLLSGIFLVVGLLGFAQPAHAARERTEYSWCKADRAPTINIKTATDEVNWDYSQSEKQLNRFKIDTINPYGNNIITDVGGLMQGGIELSERMSFRNITNNRLQVRCYWFDTITVTLHIKPTIFIASEFPVGTCKHNAIKEHELKHIQVDREIVNKYASLIGQAVKQEVEKQAVFGPYNVSQSKEVEAYMTGRLESMLKYYSNMMGDERKRRQQVVDSLNEYERVNQTCR